MALKTRTRSTRLLVVSLVAVSLMTITVDYRQGSSGPLAELGRLALTIVSPLQEAVSKVTGPVGDFFSTLVHLPSIREENERLKRLNEELRTKLIGSSSDAAELAELEELVALQESFDVSTTGAVVIANGLSNFEWTITIDKGTSDGVETDMPVVSSAGLVGHVVQAAQSSSVVQLIIDPGSTVAGRLVESRETGQLTGQGGGDLRMELVDPSTQVVPNEAVETAGYLTRTGATGLYPPGIVIGTVSRVLENEVALEKFVTIRPAVDFSSLEFVLVVRFGDAG